MQSEIFHRSIIIHLGCTENNMDYGGYNIYSEPEKAANTEELCQQLCQGNAECLWWSLNLDTSEEYGCMLKTRKSIENKESKHGVTFGPKFCGMHLYIIM